MEYTIRSLMGDHGIDVNVIELSCITLRNPLRIVFEWGDMTDVGGMAIPFLMIDHLSCQTIRNELCLFLPIGIHS